MVDGQTGNRGDEGPEGCSNILGWLLGFKGDQLKRQQQSSSSTHLVPRQSSQSSQSSSMTSHLHFCLPPCQADGEPMPRSPTPQSSLAAERGRLLRTTAGGTCHKASGPTKTRPDRHQTRQPISFSHGLGPAIACCWFPVCVRLVSKTRHDKTRSNENLS